MVSIIIPTFNRCQQLKVALSSIVNLVTSCDSFELIVIDNGSTDETKNIVTELINKNVNIKI